MREQIINTELAKGQAAIFYSGQEGFIVKCNGKYYAFDPYLTDYVDRNCCSEQVHWQRNYPAPIAPEELDFVDYVFCSHSHYDHADPDTLSVLAKVNKKAKFICPAPVCETVASYGIEKSRIIAAKADEPISLEGATVIPVPAAHEQLNADENGNYFELGYKLEAGDITVFHAGDCCVYNGLLKRISGVDVAMLPVNGRDYFRLERDIVGNMDCKEAVELSYKAGAKLMIPMHFDLYDCNKISAADIAEAVETSKTYLHYHIFQPGERYIFAK